MDAIKGMTDDQLRQKLRDMGIESFEYVPVDVMERYELELTWLANQSATTNRAKKALKKQLYLFIQAIKDWEERLF